MPEINQDRIAILGFPGVGKTTFARQLAVEHGLPHIELDMHRQYGQITDEVVEEINHGERWVVEGFRRYDDIGDMVLDRSDVIYWLNPPLRVIARQRVLRDIGRLTKTVSRESEPTHRPIQLFSGNFNRAVKSYTSFLTERRPPLASNPRLLLHPGLVRLTSAPTMTP